MAVQKPKPTLADYVTIAFSPALIMAMIVSLAFFLVAILYRGEYAGRLHAILLFFTFGIVLVARIAMETGLAERAPLYGAVLAVLVWVGMGNFVNYPPEKAVLNWFINAGLVGLVWWLAYQITYSCTYIDEKAESTGTGVLLAAGLDHEMGGAAEHDPSQTKEIPREQERKVGWWDRYQRFRAERKKTQPPGVWVVYFGLAALPIFGLGQALIDVADVERRAYTFRLMVAYLASSLGLLVTTAFLGLRRYLRQRRLEMPKMVTAAWLGLGAVLLVALVMIGALLPRPQAEFSLLDLVRTRPNELAASKFAVTSGEPGKGPGQPGAAEHDPNGAPAKGAGKKEGQGGKGQAKGQGSGPKGGRTGDAKEGDKKAAESQAKKGADTQHESPTDGQPDQKPASPSDVASSSWISDLFAHTNKLLKWTIFGILIALTVYVVLTGSLRYLANFCDWAARLLAALRRFWEGLFAGLPGGKAVDDAVADLTEPLRASFHDFSNPFLDGRADRMIPADLLRYSFEALEAWAADNDCGRGAEETPIEFSNRLTEEVGALDRETKNLGYLYARVLYAPGELPPEWRATPVDFWKRLDCLPARGVVSRMA